MSKKNTFSIILLIFIFGFMVSKYTYSKVINEKNTDIFFVKKDTVCVYGLTTNEIGSDCFKYDGYKKKLIEKYILDIVIKAKRKRGFNKRKVFLLLKSDKNEIYLAKDGFILVNNLSFFSEDVSVIKNLLEKI